MKIDPLRRSCICGHYWYFNKLDYIKMILFNGITVRCPQCNRLHHYRLIYHCIEEFNDTRIENNDLEKSKKELYKRG